jgi:excisionase family DNA binding protein
MSKHPPGRKRIKRRPGRSEKVRAKRKASAMATIEDLADVLGIGLNAAYVLVKSGQVYSVRFEGSRRFLIPRAEIARLTGVAGTPAPTASAAAI